MVRILLILFFFCFRVAGVSAVEFNYLINHEKGVKAFENGDYEDAKVLLNMSFKKNEHSYTGYFLARTYYELKKWDQAYLISKQTLEKLRPPLSEDETKYLQWLKRKSETNLVKLKESIETYILRTTDYEHEYYLFSHVSDTVKDRVKVAAIRERKERELADLNRELAELKLRIHVLGIDSEMLASLVEARYDEPGVDPEDLDAYFIEIFR